MTLDEFGKHAISQIFRNECILCNRLTVLSEGFALCSFHVSLLPSIKGVTVLDWAYEVYKKEVATKEAINVWAEE